MGRIDLKVVLWSWGCVFVAVMLLSGSRVMGAEVTVKPGIKIKMKIKHDSEVIRLNGVLIGYNEMEFVLETQEGELAVRRVVHWQSLPPNKVFELFRLILKKKATAEKWERAAAVLDGIEGGQRFAENARSLAARLEKKGRSAKDDDALEEGSEEAGQSPAEAMDSDASGDTESSESPTIKRSIAPSPVEDLRWPKHNEKDYRAALDQFRQRVENDMRSIDWEWRFVETQYFVFYTDMRLREARNWAKQLDNMYDKMLDLFGAEKGTNIWKGKAVIVVFKGKNDFVRYLRDAIGNKDANNYLGICYNYSSGDTQIIFYRQPDTYAFGKLLVHETVHGFLARYRSRVHIRSCWNEGLADVIAKMMVEKSDMVAKKQRSAVRMLRDLRHPGDGFFLSSQIEWVQYGVASLLTEYLLELGPKKYIKFINGMKDGRNWKVALQSAYGMDEYQLMKVFGEAHEVPNLKPYSRRDIRELNLEQ
ncbi:hypothetical protein [Poriferisphaera sp. WC338]|uniref:hypothetical protein n=1 Tax=Poriferisphaera sp. WC338 TaxID=3425129 RepID=UPI003D813B75